MCVNEYAFGYSSVFIIAVLGRPFYKPWVMTSDVGRHEVETNHFETRKSLYYGCGTPLIQTAEPWSRTVTLNILSPVKALSNSSLSTFRSVSRNTVLKTADRTSDQKDRSTDIWAHQSQNAWRDTWLFSWCKFSRNLKNTLQNDFSWTPTTKCRPIGQEIPVKGSVHLYHFESLTLLSLNEPLSNKLKTPMNHFKEFRVQSRV